MASDEVRNLYAAAVNYADAAQLIFPHRASDDRLGLILPTHTLIGLAIELGFKDIYLHLNGDPTKLRAPDVRHNLVSLRDITLRQGFRSDVAGIDDIITVIGDNYSAHEYRYMKPQSTLRYVSGGGVIAAVQGFIDEVAVKVGLPVRPEPSVAAP
jgi:hypothetical protein